MGRVSAAMKKDNLLSIGALSKQTGVHIKSLRYYDSLGILRPAYVDPSSNYRYYNLQQIPVVGAIQLCIDLGISLKHFTEYYSESNGQLRYAKLIERGTALAKEKIQTIQERLSNLEKLQAEIEHSELVQQSEDMVRCIFPAMDVWLTPCTSNAAEPHIFTQFHSLIRTVENSGLTINYFAGRLLHCQGNQKELFFISGLIFHRECGRFPKLFFTFQRASTSAVRRHNLPLGRPQRFSRSNLRWTMKSLW